MSDTYQYLEYYFRTTIDYRVSVMKYLSKLWHLVTVTYLLILKLADPDITEHTTAITTQTVAIVKMVTVMSYLPFG